MTAHTPGTWRFQDNAEHWQTNPYSVTVRAHGVHGVTIANCPARAKIPASQAKANALLIAAAPEMLSLLCSIKSHLYSNVALHAGAQLFDDDLTIYAALEAVIDNATRKVL
jgi:hypothetical protein